MNLFPIYAKDVKLLEQVANRFEVNAPDSDGIIGKTDANLIFQLKELIADIKSHKSR